MAFELSNHVLTLAQQAEEKIKGQFSYIDAIAQKNTQKVLSAFQNHRVAEAHFAGTTGYGYDDLGRGALEGIYAEIFGTEDALVRTTFVNGTHTITCALFGALKSGQTLVIAMGLPYDTIQGAIGIKDRGAGSLKDYGIDYTQIELVGDKPDLKTLEATVKDPKVGAVLIQRSRGYATRPTLSVAEIGEMCQIIKKTNPNVNIVVDNCYGEFVETVEPTQVGADVVVGSLIKNPGGGLAPSGGYIAGRKDLVERAANRLSCPGIGKECGATFSNNRALFQGLFLAPHTVAQAVKTAVFGASLMECLGYQTSPASSEIRHDIIQSIHFGKPEPLQLFCKGIQFGSPVDSYVTPEPWDMPGYDCPVIMAAGAFIQGASIELSCDAPIREPYTAYLQGGLTYESGKLGMMLAVEELLKGEAKQ